jgi:UDP-glucose 4-epimerase
MTRKEQGQGRVVIFGGGGFIGSHLAEELVGAGHPVRVFDKSHCDWGNVAAIASRIEIREGDFQNRVDVKDALSGAQVAIHLVSATLPSTSNENPVYDVEANVVSTLRFLDEARAQGIRRILFISSGGTIYGRAATVPIPESHPTEPLCSYGVGKLAIEKFLGLYQHVHGLEYHVLRFANPYGERQNPASAQGAAAVFLGRALMGLPIEVWGTGEAVRDYIYIADAVRAFRLVLEKNPAERIFNVGTGVGTSINELVDAVRKVSGRNVQVVRKPGRALDVPVNVLDVSRLSQSVGWRPEMPLADGLQRTWDWMQANFPQGPPSR